MHTYCITYIYVYIVYNILYCSLKIYGRQKIIYLINMLLHLFRLILPIPSTVHIHIQYIYFIYSLSVYFFISTYISILQYIVTVIAPHRM